MSLIVDMAYSMYSIIHVFDHSMYFPCHTYIPCRVSGCGNISPVPPVFIPFITMRGHSPFLLLITDREIPIKCDSSL